MDTRVMCEQRVIIIASLLCCLMYAEWIPFTSNGSYEKPSIELLLSNEQSLIFDVTIPGCVTQTISTKDMANTNNEAFMLFSIPGHKHMGKIGAPKLPVIRKTIGVPYDADIEVEIVHRTYTDISLQSLDIDNRIMPALESVIKIPGQKPVFVIDENIYTLNSFFPQNIVAIGSDDIMRGHRLAIIEIVPIQYNPVSKSIRCYTHIQIRVSFINGDVTRTKKMISQYYSSLYEDFFEKRVLNYDFFANLTRDVPPLPIHYLIITHNSFQNQIDNLAYWLKKKGFKVKVANQDSISPWNSTSIENYIDAQTPAPTYLLLVGDVNGGYMPAPTGGSSNKVTDLYYAELDGTGYLPDIFHGRLSCETTTHITTEVDKILKYEKGNLPAGWFKEVAFLAGNDNYTVSEGTHNYCTSQFMDPNGYTTYKLYEVTYGATTQDVFDNVNDGRTLVTMSGHGSDDGWHDGPPFTVTHVNQLTNGDKLTIATGHCCLANNFGSTTNPCGGESWIRKENGGAVAYYGSCPSTYWDEDDWLQREWYEGIYADEIHEHGRFTEDGMYDGVYMSSSGRKQYYYEAYHVLGDPSLDLWTDPPGTMNVTHDAIVFPGAMNYTVTAQDGGSPLQDALVSCWIPNQLPEMHVSEYTDASGNATLSISPTTPGDTMYVTVTRHNYLPYEGYALVTSPSGPYVTLGQMIINDSGGNGQANPGETIDLGVWAKNVGVAAAFSVYGLLSESDPYASLSIDSSWYGDIPQDDSSLSSPYYRFAITGDCPNLDPGETADLVVTLQNDGGATAQNITSQLDCSSPYITINDNSGNFGTIDPGNTGTNASDPYTVTADPTTPIGLDIDFSVIVQSGFYTDTFGFTFPGLRSIRRKRSIRVRH